jgi:diguanylate cyclase (GGDEF)-like protein
MNLPRTYRARLVTYIVVLLAFLLGALLLVYGSSRELVLDEANNRLAGLTQQLGGQIRMESADLAERARMVRDSANFQEYLFIAVSLDTDPVALREQYQRMFGWMQIDRTVVLAHRGRVLIGPQHRDLVNAVTARARGAGGAEGLFYHNRPGGLEMVATAPLYYRSQALGTVAVTRTLDAAWMAGVRRETGGELLMVKNGQIVNSTIGLNPSERIFPADASQLTLGYNTYLVRRVNLGTEAGDSALYFALSQDELTGRLQKQRDLMMLIAILGALGVLIIGFLMLRNFSTPIARLTAMAQEIGEGRFPHFERTPSQDEIGYLWNRFGEMMQGLRDKQEELNAVHQQLEKQATTDALTGLYNRRYLYDIFPRLWGEARRQSNPMSVILVDLDLFKPINDRHGHLVGDRVLVMLAEVLRKTCRANDFVFRLGGEEFLIVTQVDHDGAEVLAEKVRTTLETSTLREDHLQLQVTASFGVARVEPADGQTALNEVLRRADKALYAAKQSGRNRVVVWPTPRLVVSNRNQPVTPAR